MCAHAHSPWLLHLYRESMGPFVFLALLCTRHTLAAFSPSLPPSSSFFLPPHLSSVPTSGPVSSSSSGYEYSLLSSPVSSSTSGPGVVTQPLPSGISISSYASVPFTLPSSECPIDGVDRLALPNAPPPVDTPALVPDFAPAWASAHQKAKAKVSEMICPCSAFGLVAQFLY